MILNDLTIRDYFAAHALQGLLSHSGESSRVKFTSDAAGVAECLNYFASLSYHYADAMLVARKSSTPSLPVETSELYIDWSQAPEWAPWWGMHRNGRTFWFGEKPYRTENVWYGSQLDEEAPSFNYTGPWEISLRKRP